MPEATRERSRPPSFEGIGVGSGFMSRYLMRNHGLSDGVYPSTPVPVSPAAFHCVIPVSQSGESSLLAGSLDASPGSRHE